MSRRLTTVSHAILGCLAVRDYSAYELNGQMRNSGVQYAWPSTRTRVYDEPKNLVQHGLATVRTEATGARERSVYSITDAGRERLAEWLEVPGTRARTEHEALLKVFLASHGSSAALQAQLDAMQASVESGYQELIDVLMEIGRDPAPQTYAQRAHLSDLVLADALGRLEHTAGWLDSARSLVADWESTESDADKRLTAHENLAEQLVRAQKGLAELQHD